MQLVIVTSRRYRAVAPSRCLIVLPVLGDGRIGRKGRRLRREWEPEDLIAAWTLLDGDWELVGNKTGATRLGSPLRGNPR